MADLGDVRDALVTLAALACYPNGTSSPSVTTREITIGGGWPEPADVDFAMKSSWSIVSVYAVPGAAATEPQLFEQPFVVTVPTLGMMVAVTEPATISITGNPNLNEYLTVVVNGHKSYSAKAGSSDTNVTMAVAVAGVIAVDYPSTSASGGVISVVGSHAVLARIGAPYTMGQLIHRQRQQFRVTVFAPTDTDRRTIANAIDILFEQNLELTFPDLSDGIMVYRNALEDDTSQKFGNYRRGLVYDVSYGTIDYFTAWSITSVGTQSTEIITGAVTITSN
jgi:hypothetical protein